MKYSKAFLKHLSLKVESSIFWTPTMLSFLLVFGCLSGEQDGASTYSGPVDSLRYYTNLIASAESVEKEPAYLKRARLFYERNAYDAALKDIRAALHIDSNRMETYLLKSHVEIDYFRSMDALRTLQQAKKLWPDSIRISVELAEVFLILRQYEKARNEARRALTINPLSAHPNLILGMVAKENQDTTSAITYLQKAVQNDADLLDAWIELARFQMKRDPANAATYFESALQIAPEDMRIWHAYAMYWQNRDSLGRAVETYNQMINRDSQYMEAYYNQALVLMDQDSFNRAIPLWDHYIRRVSKPAKGYYYRGICYEMTGNYSVALRNYIKARELQPELERIDEAIQSMEEK